jgi:hypothetical protein
LKEKGKEKKIKGKERFGHWLIDPLNAYSPGIA